MGLNKYIIKRTILLIFLLWAVSTMIFFLIHLIPGDPVLSILGEGANQQDLQRLREQLGLNKPLLEQYFSYMKDILSFNFGNSIFNNKSVISNIGEYLPNTIYLAFFSMIIAILVSFTAGTISAFKENTVTDSIITFLTSSALAIPNFFFGPLLIILFSIKLGWLPVSGSEGFKYLILPSITLGTSLSAYLTRIVRVSVNKELKKPYVLFARAKGLSDKYIFFHHVLKNAMIPIITTIGLQFGALLTGSIVTETVFSWQGIGVLLIKSINRRDYPMVQGLIIFITFVYLFINFFVDISYFFISPTIRSEIEKR